MSSKYVILEYEPKLLTLFISPFTALSYRILVPSLYFPVKVTALVKQTVFSLGLSLLVAASVTALRVRERNIDTLTGQ